MKITGVEATPLKTRSVVVQISTDEGISGIGECTPMNLEVLAHFVNTVLQPLLIGEDPLDVDKLWNAMLVRTYKLGPHGVQPGAMVGVGIALWDILARSLACRFTLCWAVRTETELRCTVQLAAALR
ncbi:MAG TPA: hypothetical protein DDY93_03945 [Dehalococcoidia bacterium]|nr:hypothetical protein [Dehalococcoidia bacterium]